MTDNPTHNDVREYTNSVATILALLIDAFPGATIEDALDCTCDYCVFVDSHDIHSHER